MNYLALICFVLLPCLVSQAQTSRTVDADKTETDTQSCANCVMALSNEQNGAESTAPNGELPNAPSSVVERRETFVWSLMEPANQPNTAPPPVPIWDKKMWAANIFLAGATIFDIEMTHEGIAHHKCVEGNLNLARHPGRGELYLDNFQAFAPMVLLGGLGALSGRAAHLPRWAWKTLGYIGPGYGSTIHLRGGIHWYTRCW